MAATQAEVNAGTSTNTLLTPNVNKIVLGTEAASTSGTSVDFTSIPAGVRRITIMGVGVSTNGTSPFMVQLGDSGGFENTGYTGGVDPNAVPTANSSGFLLMDANTAANAYNFKLILTLEDSSDFTWSAIGMCIDTGATQSMRTSLGAKSLSAELTQVRITTAGGANAFDAGAINISFER